MDCSYTRIEHVCPGSLAYIAGALSSLVHHPTSVEKKNYRGPGLLLFCVQAFPTLEHARVNPSDTDIKWRERRVARETNCQ